MALNAPLVPESRSFAGGLKRLEAAKRATKEQNMKIATLTIMAVLFSAGYAFAGAGAPVPEGSQNPPPSGRPSAALDDAACQEVWKMASPNGDTLSKDKATPFVVNYEMVDADKDGKISQSEFQAGCGKGWIQKPEAATIKDMNTGK
jgi:hypothetical protein